MADITFSETSVPEQIFVKRAEPNPFEDAVKALAANVDADGQSVTASTAVFPTEDIPKRVRQVQSLGEPLGVTVRKKITEQDNGESALTFWVTKRIERPRKDADK